MELNVLVYRGPYNILGKDNTYEGYIEMGMHPVIFITEIKSKVYVQLATEEQDINTTEESLFYKIFELQKKNKNLVLKFKEIDYKTVIRHGSDIYLPLPSKDKEKDKEKEFYYELTELDSDCDEINYTSRAHYLFGKNVFEVVNKYFKEQPSIIFNNLIVDMKKNKASFEIEKEFGLFNEIIINKLSNEK